MTRGTTQDRWPDQPDDEYPDFLWPDDDDDDNAARGNRPDEAGRPPSLEAGVGRDRLVPVQWAAPPPPAYAASGRERRRRLLGLSVTVVVAFGLGAGAVLVYRNAQAGATPPAAASAGTGQASGQGGGPAGQSGGRVGPGGSQGIATEMELIAKVTAVGPGTITFAGGPMQQAVRAAVTSSTRFTGSVRTLASVRTGDVVAARIQIVDGIARVLILQDPAGQP